MGLADDSCVFKGQSSDFRRSRQLTNSNGITTYTIKAEVSVTATTENFPDTQGDPTGEALFAKLTGLLTQAIESKAFIQTVREKSVEFNATITQYVGEVNFTAAETFTVEDNTSVNEDEKKDKGGLSTGAIIGIVLGAVVGCALCLSFLWVVCLGGGKRKKEAVVQPSAGYGGTGNGRQVVAGGNNGLEFNV